MKKKIEVPERRAHINEMADKYTEEIHYSAANSRIYGPERPQHIPGEYKPSVYISSLDSVSAAKCYGHGKTTILNFADYTRRGGLYLYGSKAQEEALCGDSYLWNVLNAPELDEYFAWNKANQKDYLYYDRAVYSPKIMFDEEAEFDVLSCAAPYKAAAGRYKGIPSEDAKKAMSRRILFVRNVLEHEHVETAILGAFGCGVFGNSTRYVAECFSRWLKDTSVKNVIFAMPDAKKKQTFENVLKA